MREIHQKIAQKVYIAFGIRILAVVQKKYLEKVILRVMLYI